MINKDKMTASYTIQDNKLEMRKLTINTFNEIIQIIADLEINQDNITVKDIVNVLVGVKVKELMKLLFGKDAINVNWDLVEFDLVDEIIEDFFLLNPRLTKRLKSLFGGLI
jgi:hypothetical protein